METKKETKTLKLLQWNTLCDGYCPPSSFPKVEEKYLLWNHRRVLHKEIINDNQPDVICLEEVGNFEEFSHFIIGNDVFDGKYFQKDIGGQGIALFYRQSVLQLIESEKIIYPGIAAGSYSNQFFIFNLLKEISSGILFCVIVTHLKAKEENEAIRIVQVEFLLKFLNDILPQKFAKETFDQIKNKIIICGDFNTEPNSHCVSAIINNKLIKFGSVFEYSDKQKKNFTELTTFKIRETSVCRVIDYIFYTSEGIVSVDEFILYKNKNQLPEDILSTGFPSEKFPSDHLYLSFEFGFKT